jgi:hypothetical protein
MREFWVCALLGLVKRLRFKPDDTPQNSGLASKLGTMNDVSGQLS